MTTVAITGAAGNVGRVVQDAFDDPTLFTHGEEPDMESTPLDVTDRERFVETLDGADVLVHLAGESSPYAAWDDVRTLNVDGTYNAYHAAVENDLDRVVYASSNHAVNGGGLVDPSDPETMRADAEVIDHDDRPLPDSFYGVSKVASEALGDYFALREGLEVVNLRIGWLMSESDLVETVRDPDGDHPEAATRFARAMWLSERDCRAVVRAAATSDLPENPLVAHGISNNADRLLSLTHTLRSLGYRPADDAAEVLAEAGVEVE